MLLTIDVGNTNIVFGLMENDTLLRAWRQETSIDLTLNELINTTKSELNKISPKGNDITGVIIASVVPNLNSKMKELGNYHTNGNVLLVGEKDVNLGIEINLEDPKEVGADRLVNSIAGFEKYGGPLIILDFGTATTFDVISKKGNYLGGVICPGVNLSLEALGKSTAKLPLLKTELPSQKQITGKNTKEAMQSGIYWGYIGLIEGLVDRLRNEHGPDTKVIGTGGLVTLFADNTKKINIVDQNLTIDGLNIIYKRNKSKHEQ